MNDNKYPLYAVAILVGGGFALWAGLSPFLLIFLVACPLMMYFMMRGGMHGDTHSGHGGSASPDVAEHGPQSTRPADLDGGVHRP